MKKYTASDFFDRDKEIGDRFYLSAYDHLSDDERVKIKISYMNYVKAFWSVRDLDKFKVLCWYHLPEKPLYYVSWFSDKQILNRIDQYCVDPENKRGCLEYIESVKEGLEELKSIKDSIPYQFIF